MRTESLIAWAVRNLMPEQVGHQLVKKRTREMDAIKKVSPLNEGFFYSPTDVITSLSSCFAHHIILFCYLIFCARCHSTTVSYTVTVCCYCVCFWDRKRCLELLLCFWNGFSFSFSRFHSLQQQTKLASSYYAVISKSDDDGDGDGNNNNNNLVSNFATWQPVRVTCCFVRVQLLLPGFSCLHWILSFSFSFSPWVSGFSFSVQLSSAQLRENNARSLAPDDARSAVASASVWALALWWQ